MFKYFTAIIFIALLPVKSYSVIKQTEPAKLVTLEYKDLAAIKSKIKAGDAQYTAAYKTLMAGAKKLLAQLPDNVTNGDAPPKGDKHDFYAIGKFAWRNPNTPDGMPYIRGDGKFNQEAFGDRYDLTRFEKTVGNINTLCLAWYYSDDEQYAIKAKEFISVWFLDQATRMNPNLKYASALPGVLDGMSGGIIFTVVLIDMVDHVKLLYSSKYWDKQTDKTIKQWISDYMAWLRTSDFGQQEKAELSNHATWYCAQLAAFMIFTGERDGAADLFEYAKQMISKQLAADGGTPRELKRVNSYHYYFYGLRGFETLARGLEALGYDLWSYQAPDHKGIRLMVDFILPYTAAGGKPWTYGGEVDPKDYDILTVLRWADQRYDSPTLHAALNIQRPITLFKGYKYLYIPPAK